MVIVVKKIYKVIFAVSFLPYIYIIFHLIKCYFYGFEIVMMSGLDIPLSYGVEAMGNWLWFLFSFHTLGIITLPILFLCIFYQFVYLKKCLRKK